MDTRDSKCPLCGGPNACRMTDTGLHKGACWCEAVEFPGELIDTLPESDRGRACVCHACVAEFRKERRWTPRAVEGEYYFADDGRMVFTAAYHLRRGYCCDNGCLHCPFKARVRPRAGADAA